MHDDLARQREAGRDDPSPAEAHIGDRDQRIEQEQRHQRAPHLPERVGDAEAVDDDHQAPAFRFKPWLSSKGIIRPVPASCRLMAPVSMS